MKVSIITATLNSEKTLLNNINSVKKQTYKNIEQIFVDGLSKDKSLEIIKKHSLNKSKLISEKDKGIYDAMNKGINISKGEIIFILNSDDIFFNKNVVKLIVDIFKKNKKIGIVFGNLIIKKKIKSIENGYRVIISMAVL